MANIKSNWSKIRELLDSNQITLSYIEAEGNYYLYSSPLSGGYSLICVVETSSGDASDFEGSYKNASTMIV